MKKQSEVSKALENISSMNNELCNPVTFMSRILSFILNKCIDPETKKIRTLEKKVLGVNIPKILFVLKVAYFFWNIVDDIIDCINYNKDERDKLVE